MTFIYVISMDLSSYKDCVDNLIHSYNAMVRISKSNASDDDFDIVCNNFNQAGILFTYKCQELRDLVTDVLKDRNRRDSEYISMILHLSNLSERYKQMTELLKRLA